MKRLTAADIVKETAKLYAPKDKEGKSILGTGADLKRPTNPEDFILAPDNHPWRALTGLMGMPYNMIVQIAGAPDSGKSTIAGQFMAWGQQQKAYVILWDTEGKFDPVRFQNYFGGDPTEINTVDKTIIRAGAGAVFKYIKTIMANDPDAKILVVHDSVGGSVSRARAEREFDDEKNAQPATEAVENSDYMKHMVATLSKYNGHIALLLINQLTDKIGPMPGKSRSGGHKISFHSSMIVELTRVQDLTKIAKGVKKKIGIISRAKIAKNHLGQTEESVHEMRIKVDASGWQHVGEDQESNSDS